MILSTILKMTLSSDGWLLKYFLMEPYFLITMQVSTSTWMATKSIMLNTIILN